MLCWRASFFRGRCAGNGNATPPSNGKHATATVEEPEASLRSRQLREQIAALERFIDVLPVGELREQQAAVLSKLRAELDVSTAQARQARPVEQRRTELLRNLQGVEEKLANNRERLAEAEALVQKYSMFVKTQSEKYLQIKEYLQCLAEREAQQLTTPLADDDDVAARDTAAVVGASATADSEDDDMGAAAIDVAAASAASMTTVVASVIAAPAAIVCRCARHDRLVWWYGRGCLM